MLLMDFGGWSKARDAPVFIIGMGMEHMGPYGTIYGKGVINHERIELIWVIQFQTRPIGLKLCCQ